LLLLRAKLIGLRYFPYEADTLFSNLGNIFIQRIMDGEGIGDIASIL